VVDKRCHRASDRRYSLVVPEKLTVLQLKLRLWCLNKHFDPSEMTLWMGMEKSGDGWYSGTMLDEDRSVGSFSSQLRAGTEKSLVEVHTRQDSSRGGSESSAKLTRMQTVKQLFHAFINRTQAYDMNHVIGLMLFGSEVKEKQALTPILEDFRSGIDLVRSGGDTNMMGALQESCTSLVSCAKKWREAAGVAVKLRCVVLSDGKDTVGQVTAHVVTAQLQRAGVVVDAICIGNEENRELRAIAKATNGYCFQPECLQDALKLNELETMLSASQRPVHPRHPVVRSHADLMVFSQQWRHPLDRCTEFEVPEARKVSDLGS
jgi:hypothetical protein